MHTSLAHQIIDGCNGKGQPRFGQPDFIPNKMVGAFLSDMDYENATGRSESFNTLVHAMWTMEKLQKLEQLQPHLAWKPLQIIERTLEATTQWAKPTIHFPLKDHHQA